MKTNYQQKNKGFTLIEMLIAVLIFSLALAALMTVTSRGLRVSHDAQKQVIADYLAIEAIEAVRNIRDSALLRLDDSATWMNIFNTHHCLQSELAGEGLGCIPINLSSSTIVLFPCDGANCEVYYNQNNFIYQQFQSPGSSVSFQPTGFERRIKLIPVPGNNKELIVRVIVTWDEINVVDYTENLFLWL